MKKTTLFARLLASMLAVVFCAWGGVISCADGSGKDSPDITYYTVTFDSKGGTTVEPQRVEKGKLAVEPETEPTKEGYTFLGWYRDNKPFLFQTKIMDNITLTADWGEAGSYHKVTFKDDKNNSELSIKVKDGETLTAPAEPTTAGYEFVGWYDENGDLFEFETPITADITLSAGWDEIISSGDDEGDVPQDKPTAELPANATVQIKEGCGWLNSAYVIFEQIDGAVYEVTVDGVKIDEQLIRYYDDYAWYEPNEASDLSVTWEKKSYSKVVRADVLGLKAGEYTIAVCAVGANDTKTEPSTVKVTVINHDRSGFAFTGTTTPGAYNKDGTLKSGAVVIYLTDKNKSSVKATLGGKEYTGIKNITQAIKSKDVSTPVDIRVIGKVVATSSGKELSSKDLNSAWALGVKEAKEVTIEGVGHDATLYGAGVAAFTSDYIEVANLGLMKWGGGKDGDGISLKKDGYVWVHNNDVFYGDAGSDGDQVKGDGSMDLKDDSNHVTIAYNHFWDSGKMSLCGMKSESGPNYITYHHNWFDHSDSRHPRIRTMTVHVYNNYFDGNAKYGVGVTTGASCFVEGNFFRNAHDPMMSSKQGTDAQGSGTFSGEKGGVIKAYNNEFAQNNTNGVKFQFITNKYDYTNNRELGEYKEWTEKLGTETADGWVIYDSIITSSSNTIATNSLIAVEDASVKGAYYQTSKGKTCFFIDVPKNTTKIVIKAKTGSSSSGATTGIAIKDESEKTIASVGNIGNSAYEEFSFTMGGLTADATLEIANTGSNSLNISGIKVIAASGWETKLTSGADLTNIDAYEVDARSDKVPDSVKTRSGGTTYSNFDTNMGNAGLGLSADPTGPEVAKTDVLNFSGRHNSDFAFAFTNATDDASYAKNDALNNALVSYKTGFKHIQGTTQGGTTGGGSTGEGGGNEGNGDGDVGMEPEGFVAVGAYGFSTNSVPGVTYDKIFTKQEAGAVQSAKGFKANCKIDSAGLNLKTGGGELVFTLEKTLKLTFTDDNSKGVIISTEDGYIESPGTKTKGDKNFTSAEKLELGAGTYTVVGATSSSAKIKSFTFEE